MSALGVPNVVLDAEPKPSHARQPLAHRDAVFHEEATDLIDHPGPLTDQAGTDPMQRQKVHLLGRLDANEAHRRPLHRFDNRLGIPAIDLVALEERLDVLRGDQPHVMAERLQSAPDMMSTGTGFHTDEAARDVGEPALELTTAELDLQRDRTAFVETGQMETVLTQIDTDDGNGDFC